MKFLVPFVLALTVFASSCSTYFNNESRETERSVASRPEMPMSLDELLTIKSTTNTQPGFDYVKNNTFKSFGIINIEYVEDPTMDSSIAYKILPVIENQNFRIKVFSSVHARIDTDAKIELQAFIRNVLNGKYIHPLSLFELYYNAKADDFNSLQAIAKLRAATFIELTDVTDPIYIYKQPTEYYANHKENLNYWQDVNEKFANQESFYKKQNKPLEEARKSAMDLLDKISDDKQFRSLVARNDRKGVAELLRQYLPWAGMSPFEKQFWETHLKVMVDPLPIDERVLIYRGIDDDLIQVAEEAGKKFTKEEAIREQKIFVMSTMMTKNQGTWNRRLRSLTTMNDKFMGSAGISERNFTSEFTKAARITTMFRRHAENPQGSPFLSYTSSLSIASAFGAKRNSAYFLDPRMIYFNHASIYGRELEYLLPLISFPEDLAAVYDSVIHKDEVEAGNPNSLVNFIDKHAIAKLDQELGPGKGAAALEKIKIKSAAFFNPAITKTGSIKSLVIEQKSMDLLKAIHGMPAKDAVKAIENNGGLVCNDLIKIFWK